MNKPGTEHDKELHSNSVIETAARRPWVLPILSITVLAVVAESALRMLAQLYLKELQVPPIVISLGTTLLWLGTLIGSAVWGMLSDKYSKKRLLFVVLAGSSLTTGVLALLLPASGFLATRFVYAALIVGITPIMMSMMSASSSLHRRGRDLSHIGSSRTLGGTLGKALAGYLLLALGFRWSFSVFALLPLIVLPAVCLLPRTHEKTTRAKTGLSRYVKNKGLRSLYLGVILSEIGSLGSMSLVFVYMATLKIPAGTMGLVNALGPAMAMLGMLFAGRLSDRVGRRKVFLAGFAVLGLAPLVFAFASDAWGMAAGFVILGLSFGPFYIGSTAHVGDLIPAERHGAMLGLFESSRAVGGVVGPLIAGAIVPAVGFRGMFLALASFAVLGFLLVFSQTRELTSGSPNSE